jgi:hypothetical protein
MSFFLYVLYIMSLTTQEARSIIRKFNQSLSSFNEKLFNELYDEIEEMSEEKKEEIEKNAEKYFKGDFKILYGNDENAIINTLLAIYKWEESEVGGEQELKESKEGKEGKGGEELFSPAGDVAPQELFNFGYGSNENENIESESEGEEEKEEEGEEKEITDDNINDFIYSRLNGEEVREYEKILMTIQKKCEENPFDEECMFNLPEVEKFFNIKIKRKRSTFDIVASLND